MTLKDFGLDSLELSEELGNKVLEALKNKVIPKSRFDDVNNAKKNAESLLAERDKQIEDLKASAGASDDLKKQIEKLQADNKAAVEAKDAEIKSIKINNAVNTALLSAGAKNIKAVMALVDMDKVKLSEKGDISGIDEQIEALKGSDDSKFLFKEDKPSTTIKGTKPVSGNTGGAGAITKEQFTKMGYKERVELYNTNKELYDELSKE